MRPLILAIRKPSVRVVSGKGEGRSQTSSHLASVPIIERSQKARVVSGKVGKSGKKDFMAYNHRSGKE